MAYVYTKTGDKGETGLVGGARVKKSSLQVACYGTIDETNSMLGLAYAQCSREYVCRAIHTIQGRLFALGAELASDETGFATLKDTITPADVSYLEEVVDTCSQVTGRKMFFVIPGVDPTSASLHVARTMARRAERQMVELAETASLRPVASQYVNRLSDALYALARYQEDLVQEEQLREAVTCQVQKIMTEMGLFLPPLTRDRVREMSCRAQEKAQELGVPIVFAAVDQGGNLILLERMEGALLGSIDLARKKASTANAFKLPTHTLRELASPEGVLFTLEHGTPDSTILFGGGYPYVVAGEVVGAIGISGGSVPQDMEIASYAMGTL